MPVPGCCAVGSAPALGAGGREFESRHSDLKKSTQKRIKLRICVDFFDYIARNVLHCFAMFCGKVSDQCSDLRTGYSSIPCWSWRRRHGVHRRKYPSDSADPLQVLLDLQFLHWLLPLPVPALLPSYMRNSTASSQHRQRFQTHYKQMQPYRLFHYPLSEQPCKSGT